VITAYYEDEDITLYHGDTLEILPELDFHGVVSCVVTDPPYLIGAASAGTMKGKTGSWADAMNASHWFSTWYRLVDRALTNDGLFWSFLNWRTLPVVMRAAIDAGIPITSMAVWDKQWIGPGGPQGLRPSYEMVALLAQPAAQIPDRGIPDIISIPSGGGTKPNGHPAEKPVAVKRRLLEISATQPGDLVLDPFVGSGTAAIAARDRGCRFVGIEADEEWLRVAVRRIAQRDLFGGAK
jgi:DNA modification methylase